jgi:hypothetical protein
MQRRQFRDADRDAWWRIQYFARHRPTGDDRCANNADGTA